MSDSFTYCEANRAHVLVDVTERLSCKKNSQGVGKEGVIKGDL